MSDYREKLQNLLRELFQFDSADLDFGFYAVMNQKRDVIDKFITQDLPKLISDGLQTVATQNRAELEGDFRRARQTVIDSLGESAFDGDTLQPYFAGTPAGRAYLSAKEKLDQAFVPGDVEAQIYNDLYTFFARYYQDGDFISQRRYGASDKYAVPYNGEEVHLHWANFDQYYVKTGVHFQNYSFVVPGGVGIGNTNVQVRLTKVDVPRDNVKGEKRFFVYAADLPVQWNEETQTLIIPMEYRPLTPEESGIAGSRDQQDKLLGAAYVAILEAIENQVLKARLMEVDPNKKTEKNRLMYHLNRYAAENTRDFFVHKDLGNFLRREFDYYLKAEVLRLEDIDFSNPIFAERKAAQLKTTRQIGEAIIRFLDQLERFQKQLFLKRKFVLQSDYCLTLDKIPAEKRAEFYPEILANEQQLAEWETIYDVVVRTNSDLNENSYLVLDTCFFDVSFKYELLSCFDDLALEIDGLLINSENFQVLNFLLPFYQSKIKCFYIDPPYNTGDDEGFVYKDQYQHSTWLSLMENRLHLAFELMLMDGAIAISIDENEAATLIKLLDNVFGRENRAAIATVKRGSVTGHKAINPGVVNISEYVVIYARDKSQWKPNRVYRQKDRDKRYNNFIKNFEDDPHSWEFATVLDEFASNLDIPKAQLRKELGEDYETLLTEFVIENAKKVVQLARPDMSGVSKEARKIIIESENTPNRMFVLERDTYSPFYLIGGRRLIFYSDRLQEIGGELIPGEAISDIWDDTLPNDLHNEGGVTLKKGKKPEKLISRIIQLLSNEGDLVCDFFVGSGTAVAVSEKLKRKWIGIEMGENFNPLTKRRMINTLYGERSGISKATRWKGGGVFQYLRLESYDDTFHNIRFRENAGPQMSFWDDIDYLLGYMLDHETAGSPTLLDIDQFKRPFEYKLLVTGNDGVLREQMVDLVTTFNFLLGLAVQTIRRYEDNGHHYVRVTGTTPEGSKVCVLWRNSRAVAELDAERDWVLAHILHDVTYDRLYVNGENVIPDALLIEDAFKRRMFEGVN